MTSRTTRIIAALATLAVLSAACAGTIAGEASEAVQAAPEPPALEQAVAVTTTSTTLAVTTTTSSSPTTTSTTTTTLPPAPPLFEIDPDEIHADAKQVGGSLARAFTTYEPGTTAALLAASITDDVALQAELAEAVAPIVHDGKWSRGTVVYPQLGGMTSTASSIMVVVRQEVGSGDRIERVETRTLDIRLEKDDGVWGLVELASAGGVPVPRPDDLSAAAAAVVDNPRIEIPDSAVWDIYRGHTDEGLLRVMAELADVTPYGVVVLASGHPHHVFATDRTSNHTVGRAVDVYRLGDTRVIDDRVEGSLTYEILQWLYDRPDIRNVGGPWALDGVGGRSFTNDVHQDHLHIAVNS